jgi:hypothetical protein
MLRIVVPAAFILVFAAFLWTSNLGVGLVLAITAYIWAVAPLAGATTDLSPDRISAHFHFE